MEWPVSGAEFERRFRAGHRPCPGGDSVPDTGPLAPAPLTPAPSGPLTGPARRGVYVAAPPEFTEHPKVADAASELLRDVFGDQTVSSRLVFGVASLPLGSAVELEVILNVKP